jgi:hypothetical protein
VSLLTIRQQMARSSCSSTLSRALLAAISSYAIYRYVKGGRTEHTDDAEGHMYDLYAVINQSGGACVHVEGGRLCCLQVYARPN